MYHFRNYARRADSSIEPASGTALRIFPEMHDLYAIPFAFFGFLPVAGMLPRQNMRIVGAGIRRSVL